MGLVKVGSAQNRFMKQVVTPQLAMWGVAGFTLAVFALECIPRLRKDVYCKIPVLGNYSVWQRYKEWVYGG